MQTVTVSNKGQVVIPAEIRRRLGITPGCQLEFSLEGNTIRVEVKRRIQPTRPKTVTACWSASDRESDACSISMSLGRCRKRPMIALDTNILARFYVDDPHDPEAGKQRPIARRIFTESPPLFVPLTVLLELE